MDGTRLGAVLTGKSTPTCFSVTTTNDIKEYLKKKVISPLPLQKTSRNFDVIVSGTVTSDFRDFSRNFSRDETYLRKGKG